MKKSKVNNIWMSLVTIGALLGFAHAFGWFHPIEVWTEDLRYRTVNRDKKPNSRVVFIDIDEQSLSLIDEKGTYGRWPWRRRVYVDLIQMLSVSEPAAIVFDILFDAPQIVSDPELVSRIEQRISGGGSVASAVREQLQVHLQESDDDLQLAEASALVGNVSHAALFTRSRWAEERRVTEMIPEFSEKFSIPFSGTYKQPRYEHYQLPGEKYLSRVNGLHLVNFEQLKDPVYRRAPMLFRYEDKWYPSLTLRVLLWEAGEGAEVVQEGDWLYVNGEKRSFRIPVNERGEYAFHFYNHKPHSIPMSAMLSAYRKLLAGESDDASSNEDVLNEMEVNPEEFSNKIIIIGASAVGLEDLKLTPLSIDYPGPLLHATAISNILDEDYLLHSHPAWDWVIAMFILGLLYGGWYWKPRLWVYGIVAVLFLGYVSGALIFFRQHNLSLPLALPVIAFFVGSLEVLIRTTLVERARRKRIEGTLSKYLAPEVTRQLIERGEDPQSEIGKKETLTVLFSDIRGFTSLAEKSSAEQIVGHLNSYLSEMTQIIFEYQGTLDKFIGDAILSFWGAPLVNENHARDAVLCALKMQEAMGLIPDRLRRGETEMPPFEIGIGLATGQIIVGNIGGERHLDYTVIGDTVNLASRIEGLHKQYRLPVLIDESTYKEISETVYCRFVDEVQVAGRSQSNRLYQPIAEQGSLVAKRSEAWVSRYSEAWQYYRDGAFDEAFKKFECLVHEYDDPASRLLAKRCVEYNRKGKMDWQGVYIANKK